MSHFGEKKKITQHIPSSPIPVNKYEYDKLKKEAYSNSQSWKTFQKKAHESRVTPFSHHYWFLINGFTGKLIKFIHQVEKNVFVIFYSGERAKNKILKICEAFGANRYPFADDLGKQFQMITEVWIIHFMGSFLSFMWYNLQDIAGWFYLLCYNLNTSPYQRVKS